MIAMHVLVHESLAAEGLELDNVYLIAADGLLRSEEVEGVGW